MATRLILLCHGATDAMRQARFPLADDALMEGALAKLAEVPRHDRLFTAPASPARLTAAAWGVATDAPALRDLDHGEWAGVALAEMHAAAPDRLAGWLALAEDAAIGNERLGDMTARIAGWMDDVAGMGGTTLAVAHPLGLRAAIGHALGLPLAATGRIDIAPLTALHFSFHRQWRLGAIMPMTREKTG